MLIIILLSTLCYTEYHDHSIGKLALFDMFSQEIINCLPDLLCYGTVSMAVFCLQLKSLDIPFANSFWHTLALDAQIHSKAVREGVHGFAIFGPLQKQPSHM